MCRVRRAPAVVDLRAPALAVWPGEVVVVAAPDAGELRRLFAALRGRPRFVSVSEAPTAYPAPGGASGPTRTLPDALVDGLVAAAGAGGAVIAGVALCPGPAAQRSLAAIRARVGRRAPCRCVWLVGGHVYPE